MTKNFDKYENIIRVHAAEAQDPHAKDNLNKFAETFHFFKEEDYVPTALSEAMQEKHVLKPVKILGHISSIRNPVPIDCCDNNGEMHRVTTCSMIIKDLQGATIEVMLVPFEIIKPYLPNTNKKETLFLFKGSVISYFDDTNWGYYFLLTEISPVSSQTELLMMNKGELDIVKRKVQQIGSTPRGLKSFIRKELIEMFNIRGLEKASELNIAIDFMILQAFSNGMSAGGVYSNKLHSLVIGAPASGKKLLTKSALSLSPNGRRISSTGSKVTPAGLIGRVRADVDSTKSDPGIIPLSHNGIVCFEDFHEIAKKRNEVSSILSSIMEDGRVEDSTSAKTTHLACTSIHIDMNRLSQVELSNEFNVYSDLNIPFNVISRFDFIIEIPPDVYRQMEIALEMMGRFSELSTNDSLHNQEARANELKAIVAYVNSEYSRIALSEESVTYMKERFKDLFKNIGTSSELNETMGGIMTRLEISLEKLTKAICTLDLKRSVTKDHIDEAYKFIEFKLKFLSSLELGNYTSGSFKSKISKPGRKKLLLEQFKGKSINLQEALEYINSAQDFQFDERTIRRDLEDLVQINRIRKLTHGKWKFE